MTTPARLSLWSYAPLEESADSGPLPERAEPSEPLPDPRQEVFLDAEGLLVDPDGTVRLAPLAPSERARRLAACARERPRDDWRTVRCLAHLAALDRPLAVDIAREWNQGELPQGARGVVRALVEFPAAGALEAYLDQLGLTDRLQLELSETDERPISAQELLLLRGRAHAFEVETDGFPAGHDALLRELASLAPGVLDDLHFEEHPPASEEDEEYDEEEDTGLYRLLARGGGRRYETTAENLDEWYDVDAVLGFLNALARAKGSDVRWMLLEADGQSAVVVAGPGPGLEALHASGLIPSFSAEDARALEEWLHQTPPEE